jgi:hypothetical protein
MFISIVVIWIVIVLLFCTALASLIVFIYNSITKNDNAKKKSIKVFIPSAIIWILLLIGNIVLTVNYLYKNRKEIITESAKLAGEGLGAGLVGTVQGFERNWDKGRLEQLQNLHISPYSIDYEIRDGEKIYDIELVFDNKSPPEVKLYLDDLIGNHYLVACDKDDFSYEIPLMYTRKRKDQSTSQTTTETTGQTTTTTTYSSTSESIQYSNTIILFGKSIFGFNVAVPANIDITHVRFVDKIIPLK